MTKPAIASGDAHRCSDVDADGGRCQLIVGHPEHHAASVGDAYLTWGGGQLHGWSLELPPPWLLELAWAPGLSPVQLSPAELLPRQALPVGRHRR
jgi:hypothetical protein